MVPLPSRSAYTCARCQLRQVLLRSQAGRQRSSWLQARNLSSAATAQNAVPESAEEQAFSITYHDGDKVTPASNIDRYLGRQGHRRRQRSEKLKIKALDRETEVLVIRDLPQQPEPTKAREEQEGVERSVGEDEREPALIEADLVDVLQSDATLPNQEVFDAINQHRPRETVLSQRELGRAVARLREAHTSKQLKQYLKYFLTKQTKEKAAVAKNGPAAPDDVRLVSSTPWTINTTDSTGIAHVESDIGKKKAKRAGNAGSVAQDVFRRAWKIVVADENAGDIGQLQLLLKQKQWALLQTRDATELFGVLRTGQFYSDVELSHDRTREALRITGPKTEVEGLAELIKSTFASVTQIQLRLERLVLSDKSTNFQAVFTEKRLADIMHMTKTLCVYDRSDETIDISGFYIDNVNDAQRMVVALLQFPYPVNTELLLPSNLITLDIPVHRPAALPSHQRFKFHSRQGISTSVKYENNRDSKKTVVSNAAMRGRILKRLSSLQAEEAKQQTRVLHHRGTIWSTPSSHNQWTARPGLFLRSQYGTDGHPSDHQAEGSTARPDVGPPKSSANPEEKSSRISKLSKDGRAADEHSEDRTSFMPQITSLTTVLSNFRKATSKDTASPSRLLLHLIPSPLAEVTSPRLPPVEIVFNIRRGPRAADPDLLSSTHVEEGSTKLFPIDTNSALELLSVKATVLESTLDVPFPDRISDIRFSKSLVAYADCDQLIKTPAMSTYVEALVQSLRAGAALRAPPLLALPCPPYVKSTDTSSKLTKREKAKKSSKKSSVTKKDIVHDAAADIDTQPAWHDSPDDSPNTVEYFFTGVEHRETKRIAPRAARFPEDQISSTDVWVVADAEGGFSGGKRMELSVTHTGADTPEAQDAFVDRVLKLVDYVDKAHLGEVEAYDKKAAKQGAESTGGDISASTAGTTDLTVGAGDMSAGETLGR